MKVEDKMKRVEDYVRSIPDFPEEGIIFRDVTSVLQDADGLQLAIDEMAKLLEKPIMGKEFSNTSPPKALAMEL